MAYGLKVCSCNPLKVSDEERFLFFQYGEINGKSAMLTYCMLDARMRIHDNIDPNWAIEVCKWCVSITIYSLGNQKNWIT